VIRLFPLKLNPNPFANHFRQFKETFREAGEADV
jgi:hypothetical protein